MALLKGNIYVVVDSERKYAKVGIARNVQNRFAGLQTACPLELKLFKVYPCTYARLREAKIHESLQQLHIRGEWFNWDQFTVEQAIEQALLIPDDTFRRIPVSRWAFYEKRPVKRSDTGETFTSVQEAAKAVLGSPEAARALKAAIRNGCKCGPTTWAYV